MTVQDDIYGIFHLEFGRFGPIGEHFGRYRVALTTCYSDSAFP